MNYLTFKQKLFSRFKKSLLISGLFSFFGKELQPEKWVFVVGCYNSGTTLLAEIFEKHPQLAVLPDEGVMLTNQLSRPEDFGWRRMWCECEPQMQMQMQMNPIKATKVARIIKKQWSHFVKKNPKIVVEKSIANTTRMLFFQKHFPNSYFIYIVRNGYAVAEGIARKAMVMEEKQAQLGTHYPIEFPAKQWQRSLEVVDEQKPKIDNFLEINYEDLTADLKGTGLKISTFLGINAFDEALLHGDFEVHGNKMKVSNQNHKSFARLSQEEWNTINTIAEIGLKSHNYYTALD